MSVAGPGRLRIVGLDVLLARRFLAILTNLDPSVSPTASALGEMGDLGDKSIGASNVLRN